MCPTIFHNIPKLYRLKVPNRKLLTSDILQKAQTLAIAFYHDFVTNQLQIDISLSFLASHDRVKETIRQAYTNMFYSFSIISQSLLDFIACLISLLGEDLFSPDTQNKQALGFLEDLEKRELKLRQYFFIHYTLQTIGCKIGKQSAGVIFDRYIISEINGQSNFGSKIKLNMQLKSIQEIMQDRDVKPRSRKKIRKNNIKSYQDQISEIMAANKIEIDSENKGNKKFQKFLTRCITEGTIDFDINLTQKSHSSTNNFSVFLRTIKNTQIFLSKSKQKKQKKRQSSRNYDYWQSMLVQMRKKSDTCTKQLISSVSLGHSKITNTRTHHSPTCLQNKSIVKKIIPTQYSGNQSSSSKKIVIKCNKMLPDIRQYKENIIPVEKSQEKVLLQKKCSSRKLRQQLSQFLWQRESKLY